MSNIAEILASNSKKNLDGYPPTKSQMKVLEVLINFLGLNNRMPTIAEIQKETGHKAISNIILHLQGLEQRGYIERIKYKTTAIKLLRNLNGSIRI